MENLPADSATARAHRGNGWVDENYQLRDIANLLLDLRAVVAWTGNGKYTQPSKWFPLPGEVDAESDRKVKSTESAIAYIEKYRAQRGA